MRTLRLRSPEILRRARSIELPARHRRKTPIATMRRDESRTRPVLRRTLIHPVPRGKWTAVGTGAVEPRALLWRAHFISIAAKILRTFAARRESEIVRHAALLPAHPVGTLSHPRIAGAAEIGPVPLLHPRRKRVHSPALPAKLRTLPVATAIRLRAIGTVAAIRLRRRSRRAFAARIAVGPCLLRLRAIGASRAVFASLIVRAIGLLALIPAAIAAELPVARTRVPLLRSIGPADIGAARAVFAPGRVFRTFGCVVLRAERPRGKRERGCGQEDRSWFHSSFFF